MLVKLTSSARPIKYYALHVLQIHIQTAMTTDSSVDEISEVTCVKVQFHSSMMVHTGRLNMQR